jgi:hypothetical protein
MATQGLLDLMASRVDSLQTREVEGKKDGIRLYYSLNERSCPDADEKISGAGSPAVSLDP